MTLAAAALAPAYNPGSWSTFFTLTGAAAATLTGLFFVAFSMRVQELQLSPTLRTRARYLLVWLIAITIGSGFVVMPGQPRAVLAAEILVVSVGCVAYTAWPVLRTVRLELSEASPELVGRWMGMGATWLLSVGAGISLAIGHGGGLYLLAFAVLLGIALEVAAAWTLVVEAGKHARGQDVMPRREHRADPPSGGQLAAGEDGSRAVPGQLSDEPACVARDRGQANRAGRSGPLLTGQNNCRRYVLLVGAGRLNTAGIQPARPTLALSAWELGDSILGLGHWRLRGATLKVARRNIAGQPLFFGHSSGSVTPCLVLVGPRSLP